MKYILLFFVVTLSLFPMHAIVIETALFEDFLYGHTTACSYDNWISHITEGIADPDYNLYAPYDRQTNGFGDFVLASSGQLDVWADIIDAMLAQNWTGAQSLINNAGFPYEVVEFHDTGTGNTYYLLRELLNMAYEDDNGTTTPDDDEIGGFDYGWGLYIFYPDAANPVIVTTPHPNDDFITPSISYEGFKEWDAMFMIISGAGREVLWTNSGNYTNSKSLCDPSRRESHPFNTAYKRYCDYIRQQFGRNEFSAQIHSYDWNRHANYPSCQISAGNGRSNPNLPIRDLSDLHLDMINAATHVVHPAQSIGDNAEAQLNDYYGVYYDLHDFFFNDGTREYRVSNHIDLPGYSQNRQMVYTVAGSNQYDVYEPFFHLEMDELPNSYEQTEDNLEWFYGFENNTWNFDTLFEHTLQYYTPWVIHLKESLQTTFVMDDGMSLSSPQDFSITSHLYDQISLSWTPTSSYDFESYEILYSSSPITLGEYTIIDRNDNDILADPDCTSFTVENLANNQRYYFKIRARDYNGNTSFPSEEINAFTAPAYLHDFVAVGHDASSTLYWEVTEEGNLGYRIYRNTGTLGSFEEIASWQTHSQLTARHGANQHYQFTDEAAQNNRQYSYRIAMDTFQGETYQFSATRSCTPAKTFELKVQTLDGAVVDKIRLGANQEASGGYDEYYDLEKPAHPPQNYIYAAFHEPSFVPGGMYLYSNITGDFNPLYTVKQFYLKIKSDLVGQQLTITLPDNFEERDGNCYIRSLTTGSFRNLATTQFVFDVPNTNEQTFLLYWGKLTPNPYIYNGPNAIYQAGDTLHVAWNFSYPFMVEYSSIALYNANGSTIIGAVNANQSQTLDYIIPDNLTMLDAEIRLITYSIDNSVIYVQSPYHFSIIPSTLSITAPAGWSMPASPFSELSLAPTSVFGPGATLYDYDGTSYTPAINYDFGEGYWLYQDAASTTQISGEISRESQSTLLHPGWNLVSNPHMSTYNMSQLRFDFNNHEYSYSSMIQTYRIPPLLMRYADGSYVQQETIEPQESFLIWSNVSAADTCAVVFHPLIGGSNINIFAPNWTIDLELSQPGADSDHLVVGTSAAANDYFNFAYDLPAAPEKPFSDAVALWTTIDDSTAISPQLYQQLNAPLDDTAIDATEWNAACLLPTTQAVTIIPHMTDFPADYTATIQWGTTVQPLIHGTPLTLTPAQAGLNTFTIDVSNGITDVAKERIISSNYPNPFNPTTTISYTLPDNITDSHVTIYNVRGQKVITLDATAAASGLHQATWHGDDSSGKPVASGVYFYRIQANDIEVTRRMLLLK
jgi:hypothetical protein